jgi:ABC-type glycerol-3-phosphate transport system permease component
MNPALPLAPRRRRRDLAKHAFILGFVLLEFFPLYVMLEVAFKDNGQFMQSPWLPASPSHWHWENWGFAFRLIAPYLANTIFVVVTSTVGSIGLAILGAYFFARYRLPFSGLLWSAFIVLMLLPAVANIVPLFMLLKHFSLLNTLWALVVVGLASSQVFNIFVLRSFIEEIPRDMFEAAEMDGASHLQQLRAIVLPMSGPVIGTLSILTFLQQWNEFLLPLIVLRDQSKFTLGVGLIYLDGEYVKQWGEIMAAYFVAAIPLIVIFLFCMKLFVRGLSAGAIKG